MYILAGSQYFRRIITNTNALLAAEVFFNVHFRIYRRNSVNRTSVPVSDHEKGDTDDTDSQMSFSNASSPSQVSMLR